MTDGLPVRPIHPTVNVGLLRSTGTPGRPSPGCRLDGPAHCPAQPPPTSGATRQPQLTDSGPPSSAAGANNQPDRFQKRHLLVRFDALGTPPFRDFSQSQRPGGSAERSAKLCAQIFPQPDPRHGRRGMWRPRSIETRSKEQFVSLFVYTGAVDDLADDLTRARDELVGLERQLARMAARVAGKRAEVVRLEESIAAEQHSGLPASRTDAIVTVLSRGAGPMSPREVTDALHGAGRNDELRSVTATLNHLLKSSRVIRQGRGRYLAA